MTIIYEYDNTYKEKYDIVIRQLRLLYAKHNLYMHNYMFHNDLFMNVYLQQYSLCHLQKFNINAFLNVSYFFGFFIFLFSFLLF